MPNSFDVPYWGWWKPLTFRRRKVLMCRYATFYQLASILSKFSRLKKQFWVRLLCARGYLAVSSGNISDEMIQKFIEEQKEESASADDSHFKLPPHEPLVLQTRLV